MSDDLKNPGPEDGKFISLSESWEVRDWSAKYAVTPDQLRAAVAAVGNRAVDVERWLAERDLP